MISTSTANSFFIFSGNSKSASVKVYSSTTPSCSANISAFFIVSDSCICAIFVLVVALLVLVLVLIVILIVVLLVLALAAYPVLQANRPELVEQSNM